MKMVNKPVYVTASLLAILSVVAITSSGNLSVFAQSPDVQVSIVPGASTLGEKAWSPNPVEVKVGQKIVWTNNDSVQHTVTAGSPGSPSGEFDSGLVKTATAPGLLNKGMTYEWTATTAGEIPYFCQLHPTQVGSVVVS
jgi:plastocyanin